MDGCNRWRSTGMELLSAALRAAPTERSAEKSEGRFQ